MHKIERSSQIRYQPSLISVRYTMLQFEFCVRVVLIQLHEILGQPDNNMA